jgi:HSP20 family molecular chaperone IbpA
MASESKELIETPNKIEEQKETKIRYRIEPISYWYADEETNDWLLEVELPGVPKANIHIKYLPEFIELRAVRDDVEYVLQEYFPIDVDEKSITAKYNEGLLSITGKIRDPLSEARELHIE